MTLSIAFLKTFSGSSADFSFTMSSAWYMIRSAVERLPPRMIVLMNFVTSGLL